MITLSDKSQFQAIGIADGSHQLAAVHQEIMVWITKQFGVTALDFFCETRENSKGVQQQMVHVIMDTAEGVKQMHSNRGDNALIAERFLNYFKSADSHNHANDPLKCDVFPFDANPFPKIIVTYRPFTGVDGKILKEMLDDEKHVILKKFESVWTISMNVVFYYTDDQMKENLKNGISEKINEELQQALKKYGSGSTSSYRFDSKESFDRDYDGKWHYYWK